MLLLAEAGKLLPTTKLVKKYEWGPRILFPIKGENYWYPYDYNFCWMYYRKDLYEQKGLKVPTTWDQMVENSKALTGDGKFGVSMPLGGNSATQWMSIGNMWADGVAMLDDNFKLILDNPQMKPKVVAWLEFMKKMGPNMPQGMTQALFGTVLGQYSGGQIAHAPYAGRLMEVVEDKAPELAGKTGFFAYPDSAGKGQAVNHGYDGWVVLNTPMGEESMKFMEWFTDKHYIDFLHSAPLHFQPPRMDIYDDPRWRAHPLIEKHADLVAFMKSLLTRKDIIIRSIDTEGPSIDLRPPTIDSLGLGAALQSYCHNWSTRSGLQVVMSLDNHLGRLPEAIELSVFRIVQEGLNNVWHHANATAIQFTLKHTSPRTLLMTIADNGIGIPENMDLADLSKNGHYGLLGISERVALLGGKMSMKRQPQGSLLQIEIPHPKVSFNIKNKYDQE